VTVSLRKFVLNGLRSGSIDSSQTGGTILELVPCNPFSVGQYILMQITPLGYCDIFADLFQNHVALS